jgi:hypothetical protein
VGTCKPGVGIYGADLFVRGRATYLQATPAGGRAWRRRGEGEYGVASGERKELQCRRSRGGERRALCLWAGQHGRNIIHGAWVVVVELPVPCWRRHSDSSLSPFTRGFFSCWPLLPAARPEEHRHRRPPSIPVDAAVPSFFRGKGRTQSAARFWAAGELQGCLPERLQIHAAHSEPHHHARSRSPCWNGP